MNERCVWDYAYRDILSIAPVPRCRIGKDLLSMSSAQLKERVITAFRLERNCQSELVTPRKTRNVLLEQGTRTMQIVPGGEFVVSFTFTGALCLHSIKSGDVLCINTSLRDDAVEFGTRRRMNLALDADHEVLVLISIVVRART